MFFSSSRWVKFEEVVEIGGNRWSKPHVGALTFPSVFELRELINECVLCMDMEGESWEEITENALTAAVDAGQLKPERKESVRKILLKPHMHQYQSEEFKPMMRTFTGLSRQKHGDGGEDGGDGDAPTEDTKLIRRKTNLNLMKKIETTSEALNILVGQASTLDDKLCILIRLKEGSILGELTEVAIPSRFIFILVGPGVSESSSYT